MLHIIVWMGGKGDTQDEERSVGLRLDRDINGLLEHSHQVYYSGGVLPKRVPMFSTNILGKTASFLSNCLVRTFQIQTDFRENAMLPKITSIQRDKDTYEMKGLPPMKRFLLLLAVTSPGPLSLPLSIQLAPTQYAVLAFSLSLGISLWSLEMEERSLLSLSLSLCE